MANLNKNLSECLAMLRHLPSNTRETLFQFWFMRGFIGGHIKQNEYEYALNAFRTQLVPAIITQYDFEALKQLNPQTIQKSIKDSAMAKANELELAPEFGIRFMNLGEFEDRVSKSAWFGECNIIRNPINCLRNLSPKEWSVRVWQLIDWTRDPHWLDMARKSENYKRMEDTLISFLRKYKGQPNAEQLALEEFRNWLLCYLATINKSGWVGNVNEIKITDTNNDIKVITNVIQTFYRYQQGNKKDYFVERNRDILEGLCADPYYLTKNRKNIKSILHSLSGATSNEMFKHQVSSIFFTNTHLAYDIAIIFPGKFVRGASKEKIQDQGSMGVELSNRSISNAEILACFVIIPNRHLCQEIKNSIFNNAICYPQEAFPVYNSKGSRFWP